MTARTAFKAVGISISTHTPAWGVTLMRFCLVILLMYFNSHPRVGGDLAAMLSPAPGVISTHTPAWGVTNHY